jgi:hypothetical protein
MTVAGWRSRSILMVELLPACALAFCTSCKSGAGTAVQGPTPAVVHTMLEGIPLPTGFRLVDQRSFVVHADGGRHANCEFRGDADPSSVEQFYNERMPQAGFALLQRRFDRGECVLDFASATEIATVRIRGGRFKTTLVITVNPTPKAGEPAQPAQPPPP